METEATQEADQPDLDSCLAEKFFQVTWGPLMFNSHNLLSCFSWVFGLEQRK